MVPEKGKKFPMNVGTLIASALPKNAAKHLEAELGCSPRQAWRIVSTGKVPGRFRVAFIRIVDAMIENRIAALKYHQAALKAEAYAEMVERAADRRERPDRAPAQAVAGLADRAEQLPLEADPLDSPVTRRLTEALQARLRGEPGGGL